MSWSELARAEHSQRDFFMEHLAELTSFGLPLLVALAVGLLICLLSAAIRAPYYRAVLSLGYPLAPRSPAELFRLALFYLVYFSVFYALPLLLPLEQAPGLAFFVLLVLLGLVMFAEYAVLFEELTPVEATIRSVQLLKRGWLVAVPVFLLGMLLLTAVDLIYADYFASAQMVFVLFPVSKLLVTAFLFVLFDVFLIYIYRYLVRA